MASYEITGDGMFYTAEGREPLCLVSFWNFYKNMGALPLMPYNADTNRTLPELLQRVRGLYGEYAAAKSPPEELECMLAVSELIDLSLMGYRPLHVLEAGGGTPLLAMLTEAAVSAHPGSAVFTLTQDVHRFSLLNLLHHMGEKANRIKIIGAGLADAPLSPGRFDLAVLSAPIKSPELSLQSALRLLCPGGRLVCFAGGGDTLADAVMTLKGAAPAVFETGKGRRAFIKHVNAGDFTAPPAPREEMETLRQKLKWLLGPKTEPGPGPGLLADAAALLVEMEKLAIKAFSIDDINLKQRVNEAKENALNCLYTPHGDFKAECLKKLRAFAENTL